MSDSHTAASARRTLVAAIAGLTVASIAYRLLISASLQHTSLVFIGIPALLALALVAVQPKTSAGTIHKTIALALCMSGIVFGEGFICILMASPLFFLVGAIVAWLRRPDPLLEPDDEDTPVGGTTAKRLGIMLLLPMSLEGVMPGLEMNRTEVVTVSRVVFADADAVRTALAAPMRFDRPLPRFFRIGFPTPVAMDGEGLAIHDRRSVQFLHGHHPGNLVLAVTSSAPGAVMLSPIADDSYITHWLSWRSAEVRWTEIAKGQTRVTWTLRYERRLDPAWYFAPLERYGVRLAAEYLIETLATPRVHGGAEHTSQHAGEGHP